MPALQLIDALLATLGNKHGTIVNQVLQSSIARLTRNQITRVSQALDLLNSHSATFTILLKNDADYVPLAFLEEIHLLVTLSSSVLQIVPKSEVVCYHVISLIDSLHFCLVV